MRENKKNCQLCCCAVCVECARNSTRLQFCPSGRTYFDGKRLAQFESSSVRLGFDQDGDLAKGEGGTIGGDFFGRDNLVGVLDALQVKHDTNRDYFGEAKMGYEEAEGKV